MIRSESNNSIESVWEAARRISSPASVPKTFTENAIVAFLGSGQSFNGIKEVESFYAMIRAALQANCIRSNKTINRFIGTDTIVEESKMEIYHGRPFDWLLPGLTPTDFELTFNFVTISTFHGDKICTQRIYWDQAAVLRQARLIQKEMYMRATQSSVTIPVINADQQSQMIMTSLKIAASGAPEATEMETLEMVEADNLLAAVLAPSTMLSTASVFIDQKKLVNEGKGLAPLAEVTVKGLEDKTRWADPWGHDGRSRPSSRVIRPPGGGSSISFG